MIRENNGVKNMKTSLKGVYGIELSIKSVNQPIEDKEDFCDLMIIDLQSLQVRKRQEPSVVKQQSIAMNLNNNHNLDVPGVLVGQEEESNKNDKNGELNNIMNPDKTARQEDGAHLTVNTRAERTLKQVGEELPINKTQKAPNNSDNEDTKPIVKFVQAQDDSDSSKRSGLSSREDPEKINQELIDTGSEDISAPVTERISKSKRTIFKANGSTLTKVKSGKPTPNLLIIHKKHSPRGNSHYVRQCEVNSQHDGRQLSSLYRLALTPRVNECKTSRKESLE